MAEECRYPGGRDEKLCLANPGQNMTNPDSSQLDGACECMH